MHLFSVTGSFQVCGLCQDCRRLGGDRESLCCYFNSHKHSKLNVPILLVTQIESKAVGGWAQEEKEGRPKLAIGKGFGSAGGKFACSAPGVSGKAGSSWNCICVQAQVPVKDKEKTQGPLSAPQAHVQNPHGRSVGSLCLAR